MADYHILNGRADGNQYRVAHHFPVSAANNDVGYSYQTALIEWLGGSQPSAVPSILAAEQTALNAGQLYEVVEAFNTNPNDDLATKQAKIDVRYAELQTQTQGDVQKILQFWGHSRDIS